MNYFWTRCSTAIAQLLSGDPQLWGIVGVSLSVSASALLPALSTRFMLAYFRFPGRWAAISVLNSLLAVPTVVVGPPPSPPHTKKPLLYKNTQIRSS